MQEQKERARASIQKVVITDDLNYIKNPDTEFLGYEEFSSKSKVIAIVDQNGKNVEKASDGVFDIILDKTPFYAECGGQAGDSGVLELNGNNFEVVKTFKVQNIFVHRTILNENELKINDEVNAKIDVERRKEITKHHSLAHLLQAALQNVLGKEVHQAGSAVDENKTRYDFTFERALTKDEIQKVQNLINEWIDKDLKRTTKVMSLEEANQTGAMALFGEKYGDFVRVVSFDDEEKCYSKELCAGCHVNSTLELKNAKIVSESATAAGVRRMEVVCSNACFEMLNQKADEIDKLSQVNKVPFDKIQEKIDKLTDEVKTLSVNLENIEVQNVKNQFNTFISKAKEVNETKIFISKIEEFSPSAIKAGLEILSSKLGKSIIILCSLKKDGTVFVSAKVSDDLIKKVQAGKLVGEITRALKGNGGGKPQMAQGLGKTQEGIDEILSKIESDVISSIQ